MTASAIKHPVPYYSQWESPCLVPEFITGTRQASTDPLWQKSGAATAQEYAFWAPRMCGVACLRMALDYWGLPVPPSVPLVGELLQAGAYVRNGDEVQGLIYQPFAEFASARWGLYARAARDLPAQEIRTELCRGRLVMVSVHKSVRTPEVTPPSRGGHLVLAVGADEAGVLLHNPSGLPGRSQQFALVSWTALDRFFAGRGVVLGGPTEGEEARDPHDLGRDR
ncbi:C39 family peptidase [Streptomyces sp. ET3-23]|uniref:C39 family peptidase n=1 Tax=Streptomyces sp. ET3-23 TaxID=2885643 RepID=UPI001D0F4F46|nr:C39 family peptidase [Streptomyces sp. ET3-23]MCC2280582.1 C39 family peptidase [Streptomyces sp. ET3-23]